MDWLCCFKGDSRYSEIEGEASFRVHTVQSVVPPPCYSSEFYDAEPTMQRGIWYLTCSPKDDEVVKLHLYHLLKMYPNVHAEETLAMSGYSSFKFGNG